jgi:hypothetical protein
MRAMDDQCSAVANAQKVQSLEAQVLLFSYSCLYSVVCTK